MIILLYMGSYHLLLLTVLQSYRKAKDEQTVYPVIAGMAIGNPQYRCTQDQALAIAQKCPGVASVKPVLERIYGNSRIGSRYFAVPDFTPNQAAKGDEMFFPADGSYEVSATLQTFERRVTLGLGTTITSG